MQAEDQQPVENGVQNSNPGMAQKHFLDGRNYDEMVAILAEYSGFVLSEASKPEPLTADKVKNMFVIYVNNCLQKGPAEGEKAPSGSTCEHVYTKGNASGKKCGKPAKQKGVDGLPKCSSHKNSKPQKDSGVTSTISAGAASQTFSYAENKGKGKTAPQSLTTIRSAIADQTEPSKLELAQEPDGGRVYNPATNIVFEQRPVEGWIAVGVIDGPNTSKLTVMETHVCFGNRWKWDPTKVEDEAASSFGHPLMIGSNHPLVSVSSDDLLISKKIENIKNNNNM